MTNVNAPSDPNASHPQLPAPLLLRGNVENQTLSGSHSTDLNMSQDRRVRQRALLGADQHSAGQTKGTSRCGVGRHVSCIDMERGTHTGALESDLVVATDMSPDPTVWAPA